jgi:hypothetical protein
MAITVLVVIALASCAGEGAADPALEQQNPVMSSAEQETIHNAWLVDMIANSNPELEMLVEYTYDAQNRLVKMINTRSAKGSRPIDTRTEDQLVWRDNLPVGMKSHYRQTDHAFGNLYEYSSETAFEYDGRGRLMGEDRDYVYDEQGRLIQTYSFEFAGMTYSDRLEWDEGGNVIRHICPRPESNMIEQPIAGTCHEQVFEYEYDNNPKPNFGLGGVLFWDGRFNPYPAAGTTHEQMARTLSRNNLTRCKETGVGYHYTYNEPGLPVTIRQVWVGPGEIETLYPLIYTILYKEVEN